MHTNGNAGESQAETNGTTSVENDNENCVNNLNNKLINQNGHGGGKTPRVYIPPHQEDTVRLIGQHLLELGLQ